MLRTIVFHFMIDSKPFLKMFTMKNLKFKSFWNLCLAFTKNGFNFVTLNLQKKKSHFWTLRTLVFHLNVVSRPFLKFFLWPMLDLKSFEGFTSLFQKSVSTSLLKNLQNSEKCHFQRFITLVFCVNTDNDFEATLR